MVISRLIPEKEIILMEAFKSVKDRESNCDTLIIFILLFNYGGLALR